MPKKLAKSSKKPARAKTRKAHPVSVYILLDRSGSMSDRMSEALSSINAYAKELAVEGCEPEITLAAFDDIGCGMQFEIVRRRTRAGTWMPVKDYEVAPRGGTPLYDAISRVVMAAEFEGAERTVIAVMTDGYENASRATTREQARALFDKARRRDWQVIFLGADFDAFNQASWVGNQYGQTITMTHGNYVPVMRGFANSSADYATTGAAITFGATDRATATGKSKAASA